MKVYLIRHGITDWNVAKRFQGREDIELNATGLEQAEECGRALAGLDVDCVVTSPLKRAFVTAEKIVQYHKNADFEIMDNFIERDFGIFSGYTKAEREELRKKYPDEEPEPREQVADRVIEGLSRLNRKYSDKKVALVTHGGVIVSLLMHISYAGLQSVFIDNVSVTEIEYNDNEIKVLRFNVSSDEFLNECETVSE